MTRIADREPFLLEPLDVVAARGNLVRIDMGRNVDEWRNPAVNATDDVAMVVYSLGIFIQLMSFIGLLRS